MNISSHDLALLAAKAADDRFAQDIVVLDVRAQTDVCDYFVICNADVQVQVDAIVDEIRDQVREQTGASPISTEGRESRNWILIDYGRVVIHVFTTETRDYYRLERLWADAKRLDLNLENAAAHDIYTDGEEDSSAEMPEDLLD